MMFLLKVFMCFACVSVAANAQTIFESTVLGRYKWGPNGEVMFDHPGVAFGMQWMGGVTDVSVVLSVVHSNTTYQSSSQAARWTTKKDSFVADKWVPPLTLAPGTPIGYQPHMFVALLFAGYQTPFSRPPKRSEAIASVNFTTESWASGQRVVVPLFTGLDPNMATIVFVIKVTEADWNEAFFDPNYVTLYGYQTSAAGSDSGSSASTNGTQTTAVTVGPVFSSRDGATQRRKRIEFVGDSITAGYCNLCEANNTFANEDFSQTWGYRVAEHFDAEYHTEAWSGYGVVRNCHGGDILMPEIYQRTLATVDAQDWDFSQWVPDALVINLGTNDELNPVHPGPFEKEWVDRFTGFINHTVTERYSKKVRANATLAVYLACGPMQTAPMCIFVNQTLARLTPTESTYNAKFFFLNFAGVLAPSETCCYHPSAVGGDVIMANILNARLSETLGW